MKFHPFVKLSAAVGAACILTVSVLVMPFLHSGGTALTVPQYAAQKQYAENVPPEDIPPTFAEGIGSRSPVPDHLPAEDTPPPEVLPEATVCNDGLDLPQTIEGQFTVLFLGFDSQENGSGSLHDVNYLMQFDLAPAGLTILQIPRDTYVPGYTSSPTQKFNSICACGDPALTGVQRVICAAEENFGIPVDAYLVTGCDAIADIVDILGGVPVDMPYRIEFEPGKIIEAGTQTLTGQQAAWLLRYRQGYAMGDIGRIEAQRIFLAALMHKLSAMPRLQILAALQRITAAGLVSTDLQVDDMARLADLCSTFGAEQTEIFLLPGEPAELDGQSLWSVHKRAALTLIDTKLRKRQPPMRYEDNPLTEIIPEGEYQSTAYDNNITDLQKADAPVLVN